MIESRSVLTEADRRGLGTLIDRVVAADGGRLKLDDPRTIGWPAGDHVNAVLAVEDGRLLGFAGLDPFETTVEIAGAVDPDARRRGLGDALLDTALDAARARGFVKVLLITPRTTGAGEAFARSRGGDHDHSEHAMVLTQPPVRISTRAVSLRPAGDADADLVARLVADGFGFAPAGGLRDTWLIDLPGESDEPVGTLRLNRDGTSVGVYGFVVAADHRGRGIGGAALTAVCERAFADGASQVHLEVDVENENALGLYTAVGFTPVIVEDYWTLPR